MRGYRYRVNVSKGMAGKYSFDATVERVFPDDHDPDEARAFCIEQQNLLLREQAAKYPEAEQIG